MELNISKTEGRVKITFDMVINEEGYMDIMEVVSTILSINDKQRDQYINLLRQSRKLEALKLYKENTGSGLKESKEAIEKLAAFHLPFLYDENGKRRS